MNHLGLCLLMEACLASGLAGLFWPEKLMSVFEVLLYPWAASHRIIRAHSLAVIGAFLLLIAGILAR